MLAHVQLSSLCVHKIERRRRMRRLTESRGSFESDRLQRLKRLNSVLASWETIDSATRGRAIDTLRKLATSSEYQPTAPTRTKVPLQRLEDIDILLDQHRQLSYTHQDAYSGFNEKDLSEVILKSTGAPINASQATHTDTLSIIDNSESLRYFTEPFIESDIGWLPDSDLSAEGPSVDVVSGLASLYADYRHSLPQLAILASATPSPTSSVLINTEEESTHLKEEYAMSKTQDQLTEEEGQFWNHLTGTGGEVLTQDSMHAAVTSLTQKSTTMSESYERRTQLPSSETYDESKAIIRAMGVPCIYTDGPHEAEALASSMVLHGLADYVGSEDTVRIP